MWFRSCAFCLHVGGIPQVSGNVLIIFFDWLIDWILELCASISKFPFFSGNFRKPTFSVYEYSTLIYEGHMLYIITVFLIIFPALLCQWVTFCSYILVFLVSLFLGAVFFLKTLVFPGSYLFLPAGTSLIFSSYLMSLIDFFIGRNWGYLPSC